MAETKFGILLLTLLLHVDLLYGTNAADVCISPEKSDDEFSAVVHSVYTVRLEPLLTTDSIKFDGEIEMSLYVKNTTRKIYLHARRMNVIKNKVKLLRLEDEAEVYNLVRLDHNETSDVLILTFKQQLTPDAYNLSLTFQGQPLEASYQIRGDYEIRDKKKIQPRGHKFFAATMPMPTTVRRIFPCSNTPKDRVQLQFFIKKRYDLTVLPNTHYLKSTNIDGVHEWLKFEIAPSLPFTQLMIAITNFQRCPPRDANYGNLIKLYCIYQNRREGWAPDYENTVYRKVFPSIEGIFSRYFEERIEFFEYFNVYCIEAMRPNNLSVKAIDGWGVKIYSRDILHNGSLDQFFYTETIDKYFITIHAVTYRHFLILINPSTWQDLWINRALASYVAYFSMEKIYETWEPVVYRIVETQQLAFRKDVNSQMNPIVHEVHTTDEIDEYYLPDNYIKDVAIIRMLEHIVTKGILIRAIKNYIRAYKYKSATANDFWTILKETAELWRVGVPKDLCAIMNSWLTQRNYPSLEVRRNLHENTVTIVQKHNSSSEYSQKWWIPVIYTIQSNTHFSHATIKWLRPQDDELIIDGINENQWTLINSNQAGYYRVNYDNTISSQIATFLNSKHYVNISVVSRAQLIDDGYYFMMSTKKENNFFKIIEYLSTERHYLPWRTMDRVLSDMTFMFKHKYSNVIVEHILGILEKFLNAVKYTHKTLTEEKYLYIARIIALRWACRLGDTNCRNYALSRLDITLSPKTHINEGIRIWDRKWAFCASMITESTITAERLLNKITEFNAFMMEEDYEKMIMDDYEDMIIDSLVCSERADVILYYLKDVMINKFKHNEPARNKLYDSIVEKHADKDGILDYILEHLMELKPTKRNEIEELLHIISHVYNENNLDKIRQYRRDNNIHFKDALKINLAIADREYKIQSTRENIDRIIEDSNLLVQYSYVLKKV